ncbi:MAG: hypothetical protein ACAH88_06795 [Roseimicrobium sp.]
MALTVWILRTLQTMLLFHLTGFYAQWDLMQQIMADLMGGGLLILWWRFVCGKPSREYFGMIAPPEVDEAEESH